MYFMFMTVTPCRVYVYLTIQDIYYLKYLRLKWIFFETLGTFVTFTTTRNDGRAPRNDRRATRNDRRATRNDRRAPRNDRRATRNDLRAPRNDRRATEEIEEHLKAY